MAVRSGGRRTPQRWRPHIDLRWDTCSMQSRFARNFRVIVLMMRFLSMLQPVCQIAHTRAFWDGEVASARPQAPTSMLCRSHGVRLREGAGERRWQKVRRRRVARMRSRWDNKKQEQITREISTPPTRLKD